MVQRLVNYYTLERNYMIVPSCTNCNKFLPKIKKKQPFIIGECYRDIKLGKHEIFAIIKDDTHICFAWDNAIRLIENKSK